MKDFSSVGLPLQITESEVSVYPKEHEATERKIDRDTSFRNEKQRKQAAQYEMVFDLCSKYESPVTVESFRNISDRHSWLDNFPVKNRKNYPLILDRNLSPKQAFYKVVEF